MVSNGKNDYVSEYLLNIKDWMVRKMVAGYIDTCEHFRKVYAKARPKTAFPFQDLDHICSQLYEIKEDHHLVFKRILGRPEVIRKEDRHKIDPAQPEINFIANVGRLFHKTLVARELKYLQKHYDPLQNGASDATEELEFQLAQIESLFREGVSILLEFMQLHSANVLLLALIVEQGNSLKKSIGMSSTELLHKITGQTTPEASYYLIGKYYLDSGWYDRAEKMFKQVLKSNPKHVRAREGLQEIKMRCARPVN